MLQKIKILHFTDYHGYLEGQNSLGGLAYLKSAITTESQVEPDVRVLTLYGGDLIGQHPLSKRFAYQPDIEILKTMQIDAFTLGNHDFDDGPSGLGKIIDRFNQNAAQKTAFLSANIKVTNEPELTDKIVPYVIKDDLAIVGLITLETKTSSNAGKNIVFDDPLTIAQKMIEELKTKNIKKIIFLSHLGFTEDKKLAEFLASYPQDFVILGGHTHTLLGKNLDPILGESQGDYPIVTEHKDGIHKTLITSTSYHARALGYLDLVYNETGEIVKYSKDSVVAMDQNKIDPDKSAVAVIEKYKTQLLSEDNKYFDVVADNNAYIIGLDSFEEHGLKKLEDISRREESIAGNLAADGYYHYTKEVLKENVDLALFHAGGWRTDMAPGPIYRWQLYQAHPYPKQTLVTIKLTPSELKLALEEGIKGIGNYRRNANMLHGSVGFSYEFEYVEGQIQTIKNIQLNNKEIFEDITVVVNRFMIGDPDKEEQNQPYPTLFRLAKQQDLHETAKNRPRDLEALIYECETYYKKNTIDKSLLQGRIRSNLPSLREIHRCDADINPKEKLPSSDEKETTEMNGVVYKKVFTTFTKSDNGDLPMSSSTSSQSPTPH